MNTLNTPLNQANIIKTPIVKDDRLLPGVQNKNVDFVMKSNKDMVKE